MIRILFVLFFSGIIAVGARPAEQGTHVVTGEYPERLPGAFTGGFGEETCHSCHFDYPLNHKEGSLAIEGVPEQYQQGQVYEISITLTREDLGQAGFQLSSRFETGTQAGLFKLNSERVQFSEIDSSIQYLQHSQKESGYISSSSAAWKIRWVAPDSAEKVILNVAANAGNGDASAFGDYIYTRQVEIPAKSN